jgi:hypothetical protein
MPVLVFATRRRGVDQSCLNTVHLVTSDRPDGHTSARDYAIETRVQPWFTAACVRQRLHGEVEGQHVR